MVSTIDESIRDEIKQGQRLAAQGNPDLIWNWDTPAGRLRARRRGTLISDAAQLRPGMRVLEVGCGTGLFTKIMAERGGHILAIDLSPDLLEFARARPLPPDLVEFREVSFEEIGKDTQFDAVVGSSVLHHLDIPVAVRQMYELLKPGGVIAFAEPNMLNPQVWAERHISVVRDRTHTLPGETAIVRWKLARELEATGYVDIHICNFDWLHPSTPEPLINIVSWLGLLLERIPGVREFSGSVLITATRPLEQDDHQQRNND